MKKNCDFVKATQLSQQTYKVKSNLFSILVFQGIKNLFCIEEVIFQSTTSCIFCLHTKWKYVPKTFNIFYSRQYKTLQ